MRLSVVVACLVAVPVCAQDARARKDSVSDRGRVEDLEFENGQLQNSEGVNRALDWPSTSTAYTWGDKFRTLLQLEIARHQKVHADFNLGEQFLGLSTGVTVGKTGIGNFSILGGGGYDLDDNGWDLFVGASHRSTIFGLSDIKTFAGYDLVLNRFRQGWAYELGKNGNWNFNAIATTKLLGRRNFLGASVGYEWFKGEAGKLQVDWILFGGWDFNEERSNGKEGAGGAGVGLQLRF